MTGTATRTAGSGLDFLEHVLAEAGFAGGDLQLGLAGNAIDGLREREEHALIRGVHPDEHGDAEDDARRWCSTVRSRCLSAVRPADEAAAVSPR